MRLKIEAGQIRARRFPFLIVLDFLVVLIPEEVPCRLRGGEVSDGREVVGDTDDPSLVASFEMMTEQNSSSFSSSILPKEMQETVLNCCPRSNIIFLGGNTIFIRLFDRSSLWCLLGFLKQDLLRVCQGGSL